MSGKHDQPSAGRTTDGKRGAKPQRGQVTVKTSSGTNLWKQTVALFKPRQGGKS